MIKNKVFVENLDHRFNRLYGFTQIHIFFSVKISGNPSNLRAICVPLAYSKIPT